MDDDENEEEDAPIIPKKKLKDPTVDTSYLPDRDRDKELNEKKIELQKEWLAEQERIKNEVSNRYIYIYIYSVYIVYVQ